MTDLVLHYLGHRYTLTTHRAESSYGIPVLGDENGQAYGPCAISCRYPAMTRVDPPAAVLAAHKAADTPRGARCHLSGIAIFRKL
jgi:hypothetical protein